MNLGSFINSAGIPRPIQGVVNVPFGDLPQTLTYDVNNNLTSITLTDGADKYVQTYTYTNGNITGISAWIKQ